ncbi:c-type cytochrome [Daejeonella sp.]|uniref:c-type cytochrome n=1 Tax=Daejeonella sp. TaxID=2805397 RepID=UPI0039832570
MKQLFILGVCALFLACGSSTNERGIASTTTDSTASGSAYKSSDGFAPTSATTATQQAPVSAPSVSPTVATTPAGTAINSPTGTAVSTPAKTTTPAASAKPAATVVAAAKSTVADNSADVKRGEALISKSDCLACHKVDAKLLGPSYKDVAAKYANNTATISQLAEKIKKGGSGVWGAIPMSPHPALSDDDAKAMVRYILSLK